MVEPSYLVQVGNLGGEITSILKVVADLRSSHINHLDVGVFRRKLILLIVAKYSGLSKDIVKYVALNGDKIMEEFFS